MSETPDLPEGLGTSSSGWKQKWSSFFIEMGDGALFAGKAIRWTLTRRPYPNTLLRTLHEVGVQTTPVVLLTGVFIGMVLAVQASIHYGQANMLSELGATVNFTLVRELGPVLVGTMLAGRLGTRMAAELATMRITEQVDALECLGVSPIHYLVAPRLWASITLVPLLTVVADVGGIAGGAWMCTRMFGVDPHFYWEHAQGSITFLDLFSGMFKPFCFGGLIALISCHRGLRAQQQGAAGVGRAATQAFVVSFVAILFVDLILTVLFLQIEELLNT